MNIKQGDVILIGLAVDLSPLTAGVAEVRAVMRWGDTLDRKADDVRVST
ncbi:hypothetical protein [Pseudacidovorax sp. NFM-22]|nr:hypothetical protein [Pseudacidovorax sp. NFM-22]